MNLKRIAILAAMGCMLTTSAFAVETPFAPDEQVYPKKQLITLDKKVSCTGNSPSPVTWLRKNKPLKKSAS